MGNADLHREVLEVRPAVLVMSEIDFLFKYLVEQCAGCEEFAAACIVGDECQLFEFFIGDGGHFKQLLLSLFDAPNVDFGIVVKFFCKV